MRMRPLVTAGIIATVAASLATSAVAQIPDRPIRVYIPYAAGGISDELRTSKAWLARPCRLSGSSPLMYQQAAGSDHNTQSRHHQPEFPE